MTDHELALQNTMVHLAATMAKIGWHTTLASLSEEQVQEIIEVSVTRYQAERYGMKNPGEIPF